MPSPKLPRPKPLEAPVKLPTPSEVVREKVEKPAPAPTPKPFDFEAEMEALRKEAALWKWRTNACRVLCEGGFVAHYDEQADDNVKAVAHMVKQLEQARLDVAQFSNLLVEADRTIAMLRVDNPA